MNEWTNSGGELGGWKQIAAYLRVSVRTAQTLEKEQGLPVRRGASAKAPVFAFTADLDEWRNSRTQGCASAPSTQEDGSTRRDWIRASIALGTLLGGGSIVAYESVRVGSSRTETTSQPRVEGNRLSVLRGDGSTLWQFAFPFPLSNLAYDASNYDPKKCLFADIDGDGETETLFAVIPKSFTDEHSVICFSSRGKMRWKFKPSRAVTDNFGRSFAPPFYPNNFHFFPGRDGLAPRVVVCSHHNWSFPTQVAVLNPHTGEVLSEYWHRGHLLHSAVADAGRDGKPKLLLAGVNDAPEYKQATTVIFDPWKISGASRNPKGGTYFQGMDPGTERNVIFFPRTVICRNVEFNRASIIRVAGGRITLNVSEGLSEGDPDVVYEFDLQLRPINVALSNSAMDRYRELWDRGKAPKEPFSSIIDRLRKGISVL